MLAAAPSWKECSVQKLTGSRPCTRHTMVTAAVKYATQAASNVVLTESPRRARATAIGRLMSEGRGPSTLMMAVVVRVLIRSTRKAASSRRLSTAPACITRRNRLWGMWPMSAWPMKRNEPAMASSPAAPAA